MISAQLYNSILGLAVVAGQIVIVVLLIAWAIERITGRRLTLLDVVHRLALVFGLIIATVSTVGSLIYSNVFGYSPCDLCWYQRIFIYSQVVVLGVALVKKFNDAVYYSLALSTIGAAIAALHYYGQMFDASALPCAAVGYSAACSQRFVAELGYITIPMMALTAFGLLLVIMSIRRFRKV